MTTTDIIKKMDDKVAARERSFENLARRFSMTPEEFDAYLSMPDQADEREEVRDD